MIGLVAAGIGFMLCLVLFGWWGIPLWALAAARP